MPKCPRCGGPVCAQCGKHVRARYSLGGIPKYCSVRCKKAAARERKRVRANQVRLDTFGVGDRP